MSLLDIILVVMFISIVVAASGWGVIRPAIVLGGVMVGIVLAGILNPVLSGLFAFRNNPEEAKGLAFLLVVLVITFAATIVASVVRFVAGLLLLGMLDRALGAVVGLVLGVILTGVFLVAALTIFPGWTSPQLAQSTIANRVVEGFTGVALLVAPQDLKDVIQRARTNI